MNNVQSLLLTSTIFIGGFVGYIYKTAYDNFKDYKEKQDNENLFKDNTRPQNEYFGLSYGFRADKIVLEKLDSGDLIFMKFNCMNCISFTDIIKCNYQWTQKPYPHYDSLGVIYRDAMNVKVLYDRFGQIVIEDYAQFLANPFWNELIIRQLESDRNCHKNLRELFNNVQKGSAVQMILESMDILENQENIDKFLIEDLDTEKSQLFKSDVKFGPKIIVRTKTNKDLD